MNKPDHKFLLKGARRHEHASFDVLVENGRIAAAGPSGSIEAPSGVESVQAEGKLLFPSFIDAHVHLREPGYEYKEDIQSGLTAAAYGGFGAVMAMANTNPVNDNASVTKSMLEKARLTHPHGPALYPIGALSTGLDGKELAPMGELAEAGAKAISNDGKPVKNNELFRHAVEYAATWNLKVIDHCEDPDLAAGWQMNEGKSAMELGLKGQPGVGEAIQVARDVMLAEYLNLPVHLAHISCRQSVELIRWAKTRGVKVTAETCPHYLLLDDTALASYSTLLKVSPPLRGKDDVAAMREAVADGTIDIFATDHAPHAAHEKEVEFDQAPCGFIGLETAVALTWALVEQGVLTGRRFEELWASGPADIFNLPVNGFKAGDPADFFLFDPAESWVVNRESIHSKSLNSPWLGQELKGRVSAHWLGGVRIF
ncbi:dihydroorotase [Desulfovibrio sp. OttesenSCG-928-C06]|nr:dihydroorotase [Desulfovibrio sp. OttesenSCG-928-C06]